MSYNPAQQYRKASFGGCEFEVIDVRDQFGHRYSIHEYPERDIPWAEGLGRQVRIFRFRAAIWGEDHVTKARSIIDKAECGVTERLVHPIWGEFDCVLINAYPSHRPDARAGETLLDLQFVEAGDFAYPTVTPFQGGSVSAGLITASNTFLNTITFDPSAADSGLFGFISDAAQVLRGLINRSVVWNGRNVSLANDIDAAIATPAQFTQQDYATLVRRSIEAIYLDAETPAKARDTLCALLDYQSDASGSQCEYALYVRINAAIYAAQSAIDAGYTNPVEAISFMECLLGHLERDGAIAAEKCLDQIYTQLEFFAGAVSRDFRFIAFGLPPVLSSKCGGVPLLVAAHNVFGNLDTLDSFEALNSAQDAMFMPETVLYQAQ